MNVLARTVVLLLAALAALSNTIAFGGQGAGRMLYVPPNSTFVENPSGESVVSVNDNSGVISTLQNSINSARIASPNSVLVVRLLPGGTYWVTNAGIVLGSRECLVANGATIKAATSSVVVPLIQIVSGSTNVAVCGGTLDGNGAGINGIYAPLCARVNVDQVIVKNCALDGILLTGNGNATYDNEMSVTRCECSGSPTHAGISIQNSTETAVVDNNCHENGQGISVSCAWATIANNTCYHNTIGINITGGNDNVVANNTCNNNVTGIHAAASDNMVTSNSMGTNSTAGINSNGTGNTFVDNLFTGANGLDFASAGSGNRVVAYKGPLNAPAQNYFYPPLINDQHANTIVNGMGRTDLTLGSGTIAAVQSQYDSARIANPNNVIVLHLNGAFSVGSSPLLLSSNTCVLLNGTIQINASTGASSAISDSNSPSRVSISGGIIDGGNLTGNHGIQFSASSMLQVDSMTLRNFGPANPRSGGSDVIQFDHGSTPYIVTRCVINGSSARGIWLQLNGVKSVISDNEVSNVNQDGVDCDSSTSGCIAKFNYCHDLVRYGVFIEQSASHNLALGNICNNDGRDINLYNNSATPRGPTQYNSVICNACMGNNGLRNGSTGTNVVQTSHNFLFNNVVVNASISSEQYGSQNYYSQTYQAGGSLSTASVEAFFNSADVTNSYLQDANSGLAMVVQNASTASGAAVVIDATSGLDNDQWRLFPTDSGFFKVTNQRSGLVLAVQSASTNAGAKMIQWTFGSAKNDQWMPKSAGNGYYYFINRLSGLCLDVPGAGTSAGTQLDQQPLTGAANQQFRIWSTLNTGSFSLSASPPSQSILSGSNTSFIVSVSSNSTFSGTVNLGVSGLPAGASGGFTTTSLNGSGISTLNITTASNTLAGNYSVTITGTNGATVASTIVALKIVSPTGSPGTLLWTNGLISFDWSAALNWTNITAGGYGPPGISNDIVFTNFSTTVASNVVNNIVNDDTTINSVTCNATRGFHTTQIVPGTTLTIAGTRGILTGTETDVGAAAAPYHSIVGAGGSLIFSNSSGNLIVRQGTAPNGGSQRATLDLSGLDSFNATLNQISVGVAGPVVRATGTLRLANDSSITAKGSPGILVGDNSSNGGGQNYVYLGQTTTIFADSITIGRQKATATMAFNPAFPSAMAYFRGSDGVSRVANWNIGDNSPQSSSSSSTRGTNDFSGGSVDALVDTLIVGKSQKTTGADTFGALTLGSGTFDVNTLQIGVQAQSGATSAGIGTVNVNSSDSLLRVNTLFELGHNAGGAGTANTFGTVNINGGTVQTTNLVGGAGPSGVNLKSGTLDLQGGQISNVFSINIGATGATSSALLTNAVRLASPNVINIASNGMLAGNTVITSPGLIVNGTISPGITGVGAITNNGPLTVGAGGILVVAIEDAAGVPKSGWSYLQVNGIVDIQSSGVNPFVIQVQSFDPNGSGVVTNFNAKTDYDWVIANATGGIFNFSADKFIVDASQFANDPGGGQFSVRVSGNSLLLSFASFRPAPTIDKFTISGSNLILSGSGGIGGGAYYVLTSTNVGLPLDQWTAVATNSFDSGGNFNFSISQPPSFAQEFFRIRTQ
jgi:parallel beta-helix repeat protein